VSRLIDIGTDRVARISVRAGDLLSFAGTGGTVVAGEAVEALGAFVPAVVALNGAVLAPETLPTTVLYRALRPGRASLALASAIAGPGAVPRRVEVVVEAAP
jgi:hypothetical protein